MTTTVNISLNCPAQFDYSDESRHTAGSRWPRWIKVFEFYMAGVNLVEPRQQKAVLLHVAGYAVSDIYYTNYEKKNYHFFNCNFNIFSGMNTPYHSHHIKNKDISFKRTIRNNSA